MANILAELSQWIYDLPYWEQSALEKIVSGISFTVEDYDELLQYLLEDAGLEESRQPRPDIQFVKRIPKFEERFISNIKLVKIFNLKNINILVSNQVISFGPGLTVIFGANGSGKSSYVRALACAAFARGDKEVLPDATMPINPGAKQSVEIEILEGTSPRTIIYDIDQPCPELTSFYVFDATCVHIHLNKQNKLSFSPPGLSYLTELADVTDRVRDKLDERIKIYSKSPTFIYLFPGDSDVSGSIAKFERENNIVALKKLSVLNEDEQRRMDYLDTKISSLKSADASRDMEKLKQDINDLEDILRILSDAVHNLDDQVMQEINDLLQEYCQLHNAAKCISIDRFTLDRFTQIGTKIWHDFIESAKKLALSEQEGGKIYPYEEDYCLLCHQPLQPAARDLIIRLWSFLASDIEAMLDEVQSRLDEKRKVLSGIKTDLFNESSITYRCLQDFDKDILNEIKTTINSIFIRKKYMLEIIDNRETKPISSLNLEGSHCLSKVIDVLKIELKELEEKDSANEIAELEKEQRELQHRMMLGNHIEEIEESIRKRLWAEKASKKGGNTKHITAKYNDLFKRTVTQRFIDIFELNLKDLKRPLKVGIETKGRKGETLRQIVLQTDPSIESERFSPDKVLSEGEKRAVALADFLTEVTVDEASSGIILDDPVTSLDFEWKDIIASKLVNEAKKRQVIVFTHDLHFLYLLKKCTEDQDLPIVTHWIKRGDEDNKPGYVFLDNSPAMERDYRNAAKAWSLYKAAKNASPEEQESLLRQGFGSLRTSYEAFIVFDLFCEVVTRFDERISFGRLEDIVWDKDIIDSVVKKCELLSRYIEGHLHSDAFSALKPTPQLLLNEIEDFEAVKKNLKEMKKIRAT